MAEFIAGKSWGIEYELGSITRDVVKNASQVRNMGFVDKHDASIESPINLMDRNIRVIRSPKSLEKGMQRATSGVELVSRVYTEENPLEIFKFLTNWASVNGEIPRNNRCGIHFHVTFPNKLQFLKGATKLGAYLEDVFFYVGGMGHDFRGQTNDSIFCRPITKKGPVCIRSARRNRPIFNLNDLMESETERDFWLRYGDSSNLLGTRYVPIRYMWLNLYPIIVQGSIEFRVFNQTLNPHYLWATLILCQAFCNYIINHPEESVDKKLEINSIYDKRSKEEILQTLADFAEASEMDNLAHEFLRDIISYTPEINLENEWVMCHLRNQPTVWGDGAPYRTKPISEDIKQAHFVDIHNFRQQNENGEINEPRVGRVGRIEVERDGEPIVARFAAGMDVAAERFRELNEALEGQRQQIDDFIQQQDEE